MLNARNSDIKVTRSNLTTRPSLIQLTDLDSSQFQTVRWQTLASFAASMTSIRQSFCNGVFIIISARLWAFDTMQFGCFGCKVSGNYFPYA